MTSELDVHGAAADRDRLAAEHQTLSAELGLLTGQIDLLWLEKRAAHPDATDKFIDKLVGASEIGQRYNVVKYTLKGLDKRISSLNSIIQVANNEYRHS